MRKAIFSACVLAVLALVVCSAALAQETRATLLGRVTDATGGVVPGVSITVTNTDTNTSNHIVTNDEGLYRIPFLMPGPYQVTAELSGFKTYVRKGITLSVNTEAVVDVKMEVGEMSQSVTVTAEEPLLNTTSASVGQVIDNKRVMELPVLGNSAMLFSGLAFGMSRYGGYNYLGLHSTVGAAEYNTAGGVGGNEWSLDGTPNNGHSRRAAYLPYTDAIDEFRVESTSFDAKVGHTTGAFVTMSSKSGTNQFHGTLTENHWQQRWNATPSNDNGLYWKKIKDAEAAGNQALADQLRKTPRQPTGRSNNWAASVGGPVKIPWLFDGSDKLFFFFMYNGFRDVKTEEPGSKIFTMPTEKMRAGDFSELINIPISTQFPDGGRARYQIYDPLTTVYNATAKRYERQPFPNNIIPANRIMNPMYKFYEKLYPLPNHPALEDAETRNNYFNPNIPFNWDYKAVQNRIDYIHSEKNKFFGRWSWNKFVEDRSDWTLDTARYMHTNGLHRINKGVGVDWVHTFTPSDVLHVAAAYNRYVDQGISFEQRKYKPTDVGLPAYMDEYAGEYHHLPRLDFSDGSYRDFSGNYNRFNPISTGTLTADYSKYFGKHSMSFGWDGRNYYRTGGHPGNTSGYFEWRNGLFRPNSTYSGMGILGVEWAAFMMGIPNSMSVENNDSRYITTPYHAVFIQDNYRLNPKLTLNFGARVEYEGSIRERFDRGVRDWNYDYALPTEFVNTVKAQYEKVAFSERSVADFGAGLVGGVNYLGFDGSPRTRTQPTWRIMPRLGFAYKLTDTMVIRGGYGIYYDTLNVSHTELDQSGYSRGTGTTITNDQGVSWAYSTWDPANGKPPTTDPFPIRADGTRYNTPYGNKLGHLAYLGRNIDYITDNFEPAEQHRWRLDIERQIFGDAVVSIGYTGSYVPNLGVDIRTNAVPKKYWATGNVRNQALSDDLGKAVANPFSIKNLGFMEQVNPLLWQQMSTSGFFTGSTRSKSNLLRPHPHVDGNLQAQRTPIGIHKYNAFQARFEKRMASGWTMNTHYEWNHNMSKDWIANDCDTEPTWRESDNSRPHRWVATSIYELPFGNGKMLLNRSDWLDKAFGGWQLGIIWQIQSGECVDFGTNTFFYGDDLRDIRIDNPTKDKWFNNDPSLWERSSTKGPANFHLRQIPHRLNWVRQDKVKQLDANIQKAFAIKESVKALFRVDLLNAPNHQYMSGPQANPFNANFGRVSSYVNTPRYIQFQLRIVY